jgi:hypothetical protein
MKTKVNKIETSMAIFFPDLISVNPGIQMFRYSDYQMFRLSEIRKSRYPKIRKSRYPKIRKSGKNISPKIVF